MPVGIESESSVARLPYHSLSEPLKLQQPHPALGLGTGVGGMERPLRCESAWLPLCTPGQGFWSALLALGPMSVI